MVMTRQKRDIETRYNTAFQCPFSVLAIALFIYYTSVLTGIEASKEVK